MLRERRAPCCQRTPLVQRERRTPAPIQRRYPLRLTTKNGRCRKRVTVLITTAALSSVRGLSEEAARMMVRSLSLSLAYPPIPRASFYESKENKTIEGSLEGCVINKKEERRAVAAGRSCPDRLQSCRTARSFEFAFEFAFEFPARDVSVRVACSPSTALTGLAARI